jgi:CheY-like chemotaxis protein
VCFEASSLRDATELAAALRTLGRGTVQILPAPLRVLIGRRWDVTLTTLAGRPDLAWEWQTEMYDLARRNAGWHFARAEVIRDARDGRHGPVRVLIVDDSAAFRSAVRALLTRRGYQVVGEADTAAHAVEAVERLGPHAVLLDVHLPDGSGFELAAALTDADPNLAVLLTSTEEPPRRDLRVEMAGARGFVLKCCLATTSLEHFWQGP